MEGVTTIHCCVCMNVHGPVPATSMIGGYAVCTEHALLDNHCTLPDGRFSLLDTIKLHRMRRKGTAV